MSELLFREAEEYPQAETDDLLMALWFIKWRAASLVPVGKNPRGPHGGSRWPIPPRLMKKRLPPSAYEVWWKQQHGEEGIA